PGAPFFDLRARAPAKTVRVARHRVVADLLLVRRGAGRHEQVEVPLGRRTETRVTGGGRLRDDVNRLTGTVVPRLRHPLGQIEPELGHRALVPDDHARPPAG